MLAAGPGNRAVPEPRPAGFMGRGFPSRDARRPAGFEGSARPPRDSAHPMSSRGEAIDDLVFHYRTSSTRSGFDRRMVAGRRRVDRRELALSRRRGGLADRCCPRRDCGCGASDIDLFLLPPARSSDAVSQPLAAAPVPASPGHPSGLDAGHRRSTGRRPRARFAGCRFMARPQARTAA